MKSRPSMEPRIWISALHCLSILFLLLLTRGAQGIGVNWGTQATHQLPPSVVVQMLQDNTFNKVKLFDTDETTLSALAGTNVEVMVAIPNDELTNLQDEDSAYSWVQNNVQKYIFQGGVNIKYVAVANEPFLSSYNGTFVPLTFPALQNVQVALNKLGLGNTVKATVPMNADVLAASTLPSQGSFRSDISSQMLQIVSFLNQSGSPYTINIYPFISYATNPGFPESYAFFDSTTVQVPDGANGYTNTFDATYDTLVHALTLEGFPNMSIIVGEIGWATDGLLAATPANAKRFNQGFLNHVASGKGTPLRPNQDIEYYLFSLLDEDAKSTAPGLFERHWGIFTFDGEAKYPLSVPSAATNSFGNGTLVNAKGVVHLTEQWCVAVANADPTKLAQPVNFACSNADCTELDYGCSCNGLDTVGNASFAFNQYFQLQNQAAGSCDFNGLATLTDTDPSTGTCRFIVQIEPYYSGTMSRMIGSAALMPIMFIVSCLSIVLISPLL